MGQRRVEGLPSYDDVEPDYDAIAVNTTAMKFRRLSTSSVAFPVTIRVELNGQTMAISIAGNAPPSHIEDQARMMWGQAGEFKEPRPNTWISNKVYHFQTETDLPVPLITSETRAKPTRNAEIEEIPVTLIIVNRAAGSRGEFTHAVNGCPARKDRERGRICYGGS
jgi:hypothetical protein